MGECLIYSSLQAGSKVKFAAWPTSWRPPGTDRLSLRGPKVNSRIGLCAVDNSKKYTRRYIQTYHLAYYFFVNWHKAAGLTLN